MSSWLEEYTRTLEIRDAREKANEGITSAYTILADHSAAQHQNSITFPSKATTTEPAPLLPGAKSSKNPPSRSTSSRVVPTATSSDPSAESLRTDLTAANQNISSITTQLEVVRSDVARLTSAGSAQKAQQAVLEGQIRTLETERNSLSRKLRDRESEIREKARLVEGVQDEMVGLEMQVNVAEENVRKVERENKELVERWMRRVGSEAEEMNKGKRVGVIRMFV